MSDKKLLEEQTIRRFMKLAKIEGLADNFVESNSGVIKESKDNKPKRYVAGRKEDPRVDEEMEEKGREEEMGHMYEEEDLMSPEGGGDKESLVQSMFQAMASAAKEHGVDVEVEGGEGGMGGDDDMDMGDMDMDMGDEGGDEQDDEEDGEGEEEEEELDEGDSEEEPEEEEPEEEEPEEEESEEKDEGRELAEAILTRVKARLISEAKAAKEKAMKGAKGKAKIAAKKGSKKNGAGMATKGNVGKGKVSTPFGASMKEAAKAGLANQGGNKKSGTFGTKHPGKDHKMTPVGKVGPKKHKA